jgi:23S rRNA (pseudouridine1915-N3)-methyltransferase
MNITIYVNTRRLNSNDAAAAAEYTKRLTAYCKPVIQFKPVAASQFTEFYTKLKQSEHTISYQILAGCSTPSSEEFADRISNHSLQGISHFQFFVGYEIPEDFSIIPLSLTSMSMSDGLCTVVLCEQLYRSYRILNHQPYHK